VKIAPKNQPESKKWVQCRFLRYEFSVSEVKARAMIYKL